MTGVDARSGRTTLRTFDPTRYAPSDVLAAWFDLVPELDDDAQRQFRRYYRRYLRRFDPYMRHAYDRRLEPILSRARSGARVAEVGSGCGSEGLLLAMLGCDVTGLDLHRQRLHTARQRQSLLEKLRGASLTCRFLEGSLFDDDLDLGEEPFDVVWMEETFHHLEPRDQVGARIAALVRPGGHVVVAETNALNPLVQLHLLRTRGLPRVRTFTDRRGREHEYGVERVTSARRLLRLFEREGFRTELVRHERLFPNLGAMPRTLMTLERGLTFLPRCAFVHYSYVGRRTE